jgi:outer membrane lipoprotein carrier protein
LGGQVQDLSQLFTVTMLDPNDYVLVPKDPNSMVKKIKLVFDTSGVIQSLEMTNTMDQTSILQFSQVKLNQPMSSSQFQYHIPAGMDVLS